MNILQKFFKADKPPVVVEEVQIEPVIPPVVEAKIETVRITENGWIKQGPGRLLGVHMTPAKISFSNGPDEPVMFDVTGTEMSAFFDWSFLDGIPFERGIYIRLGGRAAVQVWYE